MAAKRTEYLHVVIGIGKKIIRDLNGDPHVSRVSSRGRRAWFKPRVRFSKHIRNRVVYGDVPQW